MSKEEQAGARRSQRDYTLAFKLSVVSEVEQGSLTYKQAQAKYGIQGRSTVLVWLRKHGNLDWRKPSLYKMNKSAETPSQTIKRLEKELSDERLRVKILNTMIDIADEQYGTSIRKKYSPKQQDASKKKRR